MSRSKEELAADAIRKIVKDLNQYVSDAMAQHHFHIDITVLERATIHSSCMMPTINVTICKEVV